jgi:hypothetical protein
VQPYRETKTFVIRIELEAEFADDYAGDDDGGEWLRRWMSETRPEVVAAVMRALAADRRFRITPQSRGKHPEDEVEIGVSLRVRTDPDT